MGSSTTPTRLPLPEPGRRSAEDYVGRFLHGLYLESMGGRVDDDGRAGGQPVRSSDRFRGGQSEADRRLASLDLRGFGSSRNHVYPSPQRSASELSPYIRHGLANLAAVAEVAAAAGADGQRFIVELAHQEYARHWYARIGYGSTEPTRRRLRFPDHDPTGAVLTDEDFGGADPAAFGFTADSAVSAAPGASQASGASPTAGSVDAEMGCLELAVGELVDDGYLPSQARLWLASHWSVRRGRPWRQGEEIFFRHLLDGSRAANRLGWQQAVGLGAPHAYGFSRWQVEERAPGLCASCARVTDCPIADFADEPDMVAVAPPAGYLIDPDPATTAGPAHARVIGQAEAVWITAESMGDADPALAAHPDLPAVFVFDQPLLARLRLSSKRLVFLVETLADLARRRPVEIHLGRPTEILAGRPLAVTYTPVPGWRRKQHHLNLVDLRPWPWLHRPSGEPLDSFDVWFAAVAETAAGDDLGLGSPDGSGLETTLRGRRELTKASIVS